MKESSSNPRYKYPPANKETVCNIARACLHHPKFYHQVLHLMNKMNLMPPFVPVPSQFLDDLQNKNFESSSSDESEIESGYYVNNDDLLGKSFKRQAKKLKIGILGEIRKRPMTGELRRCSNLIERDVDVFEPYQLNPVSIKLNINSTELTTSKFENNNEDSHGFGRISPKATQVVMRSEDESDDWINCLLARDELKNNRLSPEELANIPAYKDYSSGSRSCRLYLKNLSKKVTERDLKRIYGAYIDLNNECDRNMFHVQLFKTGRFRNQAFISLPNEESASFALADTNGYLIEGKPIIVCYARSTKPNATVTS